MADAEAKQPFASVTAAVNVPPGRSVRGLSPRPGWLPQFIEKGGVPPVKFSKIEPSIWPQFAAVAAAVAVGLGAWPTCIDVVTVQFDASVTVAE